MSNLTYSRKWDDVNTRIGEIAGYENPEEPSLLTKDRESAFQQMATLYIKYIQLYRKLEDSYDEILQPQKRRLMRKGLVATMGRLIEVRHILVGLECTDFFNFNDILLDLNLTPDALEIPIPRFVAEERSDIIEKQTGLLNELNAKDFKFGSPQLVIPKMSVADAVKIIQTNERARQGALRAKYMRDIKLQAQKEKEMLIGLKDNSNEVEEAVVKIQTFYRGVRDRVNYKARMQQELEFLGMESKQEMSKDSASLAKNNRDRRKLLQAQFEQDYLQALVTTKEKILRMEGPDMKQAFQDEFRQWYMEYKKINGKFPEFPSEEIWKNPNFKFSLENETVVPPKPEEKVDTTKKDKKGSAKEKPAPAKSADKKKGKVEVTEDPAMQFNYGNSVFLETMNENKTQYTSYWKYKDESDNFAQKHDQEIIKADKRKEVEAEIKEEVFVVLQEELKNLILAVEKDSGKKGKKGGKAKGGKGKKKDKGKKGKKEKDLTANRTMESLVEELIQTGLLQKYEKCEMNSIYGNFNLLDSSTSRDPIIIPTVAELKRAITEYCILPLGVAAESGVKMPYPKIASVLLTGPQGTGKKHLVQAIASEIGAQIFNLSPRNTAGQFGGKSNVTKMVHMVFKVARAQAPSVIYIDGIEMVFAKKVPKDDTSDPKRIKKDLVKSIKLIRDHSERVILIATSVKPWEGDLKAMLQIFDKVLYCPPPDYNSRYKYWNQMISKFTKPTVNISLLTKMSEGLTAGTIELICGRLLTPRRVKNLRVKPLVDQEFLNVIFETLPQSNDEKTLFKDFMEKISLNKKRAALLKGPEVEEEAPKKAAKKK